MSLRVFPDQNAIIDACCQAWNALVAENGRIKSLCYPPWLQKGAFKQTTRKSHRISGERVRPGGLQAMLLEPIVQIGLGGVIAPRDELLRRTVRQQALDLRPKGIQLALARSP